MKHKILTGVATGLFLATMAGAANATLVNVGTATYQGAEYGLIYDDDNNGNSVVWLDYTNAASGWDDQMSWAAGLGSGLTVTLNAGLSSSTDWSTGWRLSSVGTNPAATYGATSSEIGHLFYTELGERALGSPTLNDPPSPFNNLATTFYWQDTLYSDDVHAWDFDMQTGFQNRHGRFGLESGLALITADITTVPVPAAAWLFGSGLLGLAGIARRKKTA